MGELSPIHVIENELKRCHADLKSPKLQAGAHEAFLEVVTRLTTCLVEQRRLLLPIQLPISEARGESVKKTGNA
jgi:hypothetical protein